MTPRDQQRLHTELTVLSSHTLMVLNFMKITEVELMQKNQLSCYSNLLTSACPVDVNIRQTQIKFWSLELDAVVSEEMQARFQPLKEHIM